MPKVGDTVTIKEPYGKIVTGKIVEASGHSIKVADPVDKKQFYVVSPSAIQNSAFPNGQSKAHTIINQKMQNAGLKVENAGKSVYKERGFDVFEWDTAKGKEYYVYAPTTHKFLGSFTSLQQAKDFIKKQ